MDAELQREITEIGRKFRELIASLDDRTLKDVLIYAAQPLVEKASRSAPVSRKLHYRYNTPKLVRKLRAPNGKGVRVATYGPGNLGRSIQSLSFRRMKRSILVGPKLGRQKPSKGKFVSRARVDGWYAHFVEAGTKKQRAQGFLKAAAGSTRQIVVKRLGTSLEQLLQRRATQLGLT